MMKVLVVLMLFGSVYTVQSQTVCLQEFFAAFGDINDMKLELKNLQEKNKEQAVKLDTQRTDVGNLKRQLQGEQVAFAASLWTSGTPFFGPYSGVTPMVFKHVFTNIGNAYSPVTGRFTAPRRGAYHFEYHIYGYGVKYVGAWLMKNSEHIVFASQSNNQPFYGSASNSVTLLLKAGDVVYMSQLRGTKVYDDGGHQTTFSGHMLFSM